MTAPGQVVGGAPENGDGPSGPEAALTALGLDATAPLHGGGSPGLALTLPEGVRLLDGLRGALAVLGADSAGHLQTPPVLPVETADRAGYTESFPHLLGGVRVREDGDALGPLVLTPAVCHHLYPLWQGRSLTGPSCVSAEGSCFRNEATAEPGRLRSFRMYEVVYAGEPDDVLAWRDGMLRRTTAWFERLGLDPVEEPASDPFTGRGGVLLGRMQTAEGLKWEVSVPVDAGRRQAVASFNYHKDQFGRAFSFRAAGGGDAHTACAAFGLDRLLLALSHSHGGPGVIWAELLRDALTGA